MCGFFLYWCFLSTRLCSQKNSLQYGHMHFNLKLYNWKYCKWSIFVWPKMSRQTLVFAHFLTWSWCCCGTYGGTRLIIKIILGKNISSKIFLKNSITWKEINKGKSITYFNSSKNSNLILGSEMKKVDSLFVDQILEKK